jgi:hypothetical protein
MKIGLAKSVHIMNKYTVQPMNVNMVCTTLLWLKAKYCIGRSAAPSQLRA